MTTVEGGVPEAVPRRSDVDVLLDQLRGIEAWTAAHREPVGAPDGAASPEARRELVRRSDVLTRQRYALMDWTARQLRDSDRLLRSMAATRAVVAHRNAWLRDEVVTGLQVGGVEVMAGLDNGADALGIVVAEQPDLLLLEDELPMVNGLEIVRAASRYAPRTVVVVQVADDAQAGPFLDAGARAVYTRRTPPADLATALLGVLAD